MQCTVVILWRNPWITPKVLPRIDAKIEQARMREVWRAEVASHVKDKAGVKGAEEEGRGN